jgi:hypothetical protein
MLFRWFVLRGFLRKLTHNHRPPTVHSTRMEDEFVRLKQQAHHDFHLKQLHRKLGEDVSRVMSQPLHLGGEHDAPTISDQAHRTDKIPNPEEE